MSPFIYRRMNESVTTGLFLLVAFMLPLCMKSLTGVWLGRSGVCLKILVTGMSRMVVLHKCRRNLKKWKFVRKLMSGF
ncbi:Uncharacterised protein [Vibrio cholerae]|nr:Uncharacterised protein [Vibrio cholerae]